MQAVNACGDSGATVPIMRSTDAEAGMGRLRQSMAGLRARAWPNKWRG